MKIIAKIFTAAIALTIAALPITQASARDRGHSPRYESPSRYVPVRPKPQAQPHRPQVHKPQYRPHVQPPRYQAQRPHYQPSPVQKRKWAKGHRFQDWKRHAEVRDYRRHGLQRPTAGQRWVKVDNDYLLVSIASGIIAGIIAGR